MNISQLSEFVGNHTLLVMAFVIIVILLIAGEVRHRLGGTQALEPSAATRMLNHENAVMIDMRTDKEYQAGHIVNALHLPEIDDNSMKKLEDLRGRPLIVYCRSGQRSPAFCSRLSKQGFDAVFQLKGGLHAWQNANLPLSKQHT